MDISIQIVGSILLAAVPAIIWGYVFYRKNPGQKMLIFLTFVVGTLSVFPILLYKALWDHLPWINAFKLAENYKFDVIGLTNFTFLPLSVIITFMLVGVIEEITKMFAVTAVGGEKNFQTVDDVIEFFVIAALGFAFTENILYFFNIWVIHGTQDLLLPFLFRSSFSTLAHLIFSGILGYYYGIAHFASPILQEEIRKNRKHWTKKLHKLLSIRKEKLFAQEHIIEGLLVAIGLHAIFNILLEMNWTFMIVPFLVGGYIALSYFFEKKQDHKNWGNLLSRMKASVLRD